MRFTFLKRAVRGLILGCATVGLMAGAALAAEPLKFYFPINVGGPVQKLVDSMVADFMKEHPNISVEAVYSGNYQETIAKCMTALRGGEPPHIAVILSTDMFSLIDEDAIVSYDELLKTDGDKTWINSFYPAFMKNSQTGGKTWGIPFQRSTLVMYWNKDMFKEAGLDPDKAPANWDEMLAFAQKLTKRDANGKVTQWGISIPSSGFPYWTFQPLPMQNSQLLMNSEGTQVYFNNPKVIEALGFWVDLASKHKVMPEGIIDWGTTPKDFFERRTAMIWHTTGNLTNVRKTAQFPFGVGFIPARERFGSPTGGGNFYIFKRCTPEQRADALTFIKWMTSPERAAQWGIETGYVATRPDAWETPAMKAYVADFPVAAVARDQLKYAEAEFSTHDNQRVTKLFNDQLQAALLGTKTPEQAMKDAQREADRILRRYQK